MDQNKLMLQAQNATFTILNIGDIHNSKVWYI